MSKDVKVTPIGEALWPKLYEPDTKFDPDGVYSVKLRIDKEDAYPLIEAFDAIVHERFEAEQEAAKNARERNKIKMADPCYTFEEDEDGNETGYVLMNFKSKASGVSKKTGKPWKRTIPVFDSKRSPIDLSSITIGNGSKIKVAYTASPFYTASIGVGISLRLEAVQVIELVEYGVRSADGYGFSEEDGFDADVHADTAFANSTPSDDDEADF